MARGAKKSPNDPLAKYSEKEQDAILKGRTMVYQELQSRRLGNRGMSKTLQGELQKPDVQWYLGSQNLTMEKIIALAEGSKASYIGLKRLLSEPIRRAVQKNPENLQKILEVIDDTRDATPAQQAAALDEVAEEILEGLEAADSHPSPLIASLHDEEFDVSASLSALPSVVHAASQPQEIAQDETVTQKPAPLPVETDVTFSPPDHDSEPATESTHIDTPESRATTSSSDDAPNEEDVSDVSDEESDEDETVGKIAALAEALPETDEEDKLRQTLYKEGVLQLTDHSEVVAAALAAEKKIQALTTEKTLDKKTQDNLRHPMIRRYIALGLMDLDKARSLTVPQRQMLTEKDVSALIFHTHLNEIDTTRDRKINDGYRLTVDKALGLGVSARSTLTTAAIKRKDKGLLLKPDAWKRHMEKAERQAAWSTEGAATAKESIASWKGRDAETAAAAQQAGQQTSRTTIKK